MSRWKLWYTPGKNGCERCGNKTRDVASAGFLSGQMWCGPCLRETGKA